MRFHKLKADDMLNGEGLRMVLFLSGCEHHCKNCHNPETWDCNSGIEFTDSHEAAIRLGLSVFDYHDGITLTGGDPLHPKNRNDVLKFVKHFKKCFQNRKTIWLYTGYLWEDIVKDEIMYKVIKNVDVVVDGKFVEELADINYPYAGSTNQRVIDVKKSLKEKKIILKKY